MASKDKLLGRLSACATLVALGGILIVPFMPVREAKRVEDMRANLMRPADTRPSGMAPMDQFAAKAVPAPQAPVQSAPAAGANAPVVPVPDVWTEAEQAAGLRECLRLLAPVAAEVTIEQPMKKGPCGSPAPVLLRSIGSSAKVDLISTPKMNCRLAAGLVRWVDTVLQPAARETLGSRITRIVGASSYSCRTMYSDPKKPLSEHATGNAIDIGGFVTADGRTITVKKGWGPTERDIAAAEKKKEEQAAAAKVEAKGKKDKKAAKARADADGAEAKGAAGKRDADGKGSLHKAGFTTEAGKRAPVVPATGSLSAAKTTEAAFLKRLHNGACGVFGTVLGPEANEAHRDHFHFDMKARRRRSVCH